MRNLDFTVSDECTQIGFFNKRTIETIDIFENVEQVFENIEFSVKK